MADIRYNPQVSLLCKQVQAGSDAAFNQLWSQFSKFAVSVANRIAVQHTSDRKDLVLQACRLGIWQAAMRYDPDKGAFTTYASWWIKNSVHDAIGELMQSHGMSDIDLYADDLGDQQEMDLQALQQDQEHIRYIVSTCKELTACEASYARMRWVEGLRAVDVVERMGYSKQRASQLEQQVLAKLQRVIRFDA